MHLPGWMVRYAQACAVSGVLIIITACDKPGTVSGMVVDQSGPIAGATVRVQATENKTETGRLGGFSLSSVDLIQPVTVTAWADGYYVGWARLTRDNATDVRITLTPYYTGDNADYDWFSLESAEGSKSCGHCMPAYPEWLEDAHSRSASNERFLTMYNGTDVNGNKSPQTRYISVKDYGIIPLPPDPDKPYYGPGYKLDYPDTAGNCAACHVPGPAALPGMAYAADPNDAEGIYAEGIFCEFCHKIGDVLLDNETGLPPANHPGVLSMKLFRPEEGRQLFFGQFDDVTRRVSRLPLIEESAYCSPCHYGVFWDIPVYNSYGEWLESPYSDPESGQTCQDCHMPPVEYDYFVYPDKGGYHRDPGRILSHTMPGAADEDLLHNSVSMTVDGCIKNNEVRVSVSITNDQTGHHVPTDSPLRHLILVVHAQDETGGELVQIDGETIPVWAGEGDPEEGYYAGLPGKVFAKVLEESWTGLSPTANYWSLFRIASDNRIAAFQTDTGSYVFDASAAQSATVSARLIYRRAFKELMDQKGWAVPDIIMEHSTITLQREDDE